MPVFEPRLPLRGELLGEPTSTSALLPSPDTGSYLPVSTLTLDTCCASMRSPTAMRARMFSGVAASTVSELAAEVLAVVPRPPIKSGHPPTLASSSSHRLKDSITQVRFTFYRRPAAIPLMTRLCGKMYGLFSR
jgi:hypothetical protein